MFRKSLLLTLALVPMNLPLVAMSQEEANELLRQALRMKKPKDVMRKALKAGAQRDLVDDNGDTVLHVAAKYGRKDFIRAFLPNMGNLSINVQNKEGHTPLYIALWGGHVECATLLVNHPEVDVNKAENEGLTPLHQAVLGQRPDLVKLLLEKGAKHDVRTNKGYTPWYFSQLLKADECKAILENPPEPKKSFITSRNLCGTFCLLAVAGYYVYTRKNRKASVATGKKSNAVVAH